MFNIMIKSKTDLMDLYNKIYNEVVEIIGYEPDDIYLMGSFVFGKPNKHSDIDIFVRNKKIKMLNTLHVAGNLGFFDILLDNDTNICYSHLNLKTGMVVLGNPHTENKQIQKKNKLGPHYTRQENLLNDIWGTNLIELSKKYNPNMIYNNYSLRGLI